MTWLMRFVQLDLIMLLTSTLAAVLCALLGNYLVLRRQALMGDAISHAVLPGLIGAFLLVHDRSFGPMFIGAVASGTTAALLIEMLRRLGKMDAGTAMAVVFTVFFAAGVLMLEGAHAEHVDLDTECVLMGQVEHVAVAWMSEAPRTVEELFSWHTVASMPRQTLTLAGGLAVAVAFMLVFAKELRITSFDPGHAASIGIRPGLMNGALMVLVAVAVVASFEAVGSILVIAMLIAPAASARMLTDRLRRQVWLSVAYALASAVLGHVVAVEGPSWFGYRHAVSSSGMMAVAAGGLLGVTVIVSPRYGVLAQQCRRFAHRVRVAREDLLAGLYRASEQEMIAPERRGVVARLSAISARRIGQVEGRGDAMRLTERGLSDAAAIVRSHRLWERYLVERAGLRSDHVHNPAEVLEHLVAQRSRLSPRGEGVDPHERPIPPERAES